jgi:hypothetical protein
MFEIISPERYGILRGRKLDNLYRMSKYEWRGEIENGKYFILIEYKMLLVQIDIQKREMNLGTAKRVVLGNPEKDFNIYDCCDFLKWEYDKENIID